MLQIMNRYPPQLKFCVLYYTIIPSQSPIAPIPAPHRGERVNSKAELPSVVKTSVEVPPIGRYARWTGSLGTHKYWLTQEAGVGRTS